MDRSICALFGQEFLMSSRLAESSRDVSRYYILLEPVHTILAQACRGSPPVRRSRRPREDRELPPREIRCGTLGQERPSRKMLSSRIMDGTQCQFEADQPHFMA